MKRTLQLAGSRTISGNLPALIMGILNVTPDSFWEQSRAFSVDAALERALLLEDEGADILDIGGESTRPGSEYVDEAEEKNRILPVITAIRQKSDIPISIDTRKSGVMRAAFNAGADICNDISALEDDPEMAPFVAEAGIPVILMHKQGVPASMQKHPVYSDPVQEVKEYLLARARFAENAGIGHDKIILDPGIGFGKRYEDNCALINGLRVLTETGYPVLMALSRKSCIGRMTGRTTDDRLAGTLAANLIAVQKGAAILRVHDVAQTHDILSVLQEITTGGIH